MIRSPLGSLAPLGGRRFERIENLVFLGRIGSTNEVGRDLAGRMLAEQNDLFPTVILAERQEGGRGRAGRRWESPEGSLAVSLVVPWPGTAQRVRLPLAIGIPLARRLSAAFEIEVRLKWPNDLTAGGKKLGGILIETRQGPDGEGSAVIGVGLNATTSRAVLDQLGLEGATSLLVGGAKEELLVGDLPLAALLAALYAALGEELEELEAAFLAVSTHALGDAMAVHDGPKHLKGTFSGLTAEGFLRLKTPSGDEIVVSGEVESF